MKFEYFPHINLINPLNHPAKEAFIPPLTWRRKWQPTAVFLPGKSHGQISLGGGGGLATVHRVTRVRHNLATKPPPPMRKQY